MLGLLQRLKWRRTKAFFPFELTAIRMLLPLNDARAESLLRQAVEAPAVRRRWYGGSRYEASPEYVVNPMNLIDLQQNVTSPNRVVPDLNCGRDIRFRLELLKGGFLGKLICESVDGSPISAVLSLNEEPGIGANWLPLELSAVEQKRVTAELFRWVGVDPAKIQTDLLTLRRGATPDDLRNLEHSSRCALPAEYREFLSITNGLRVGSMTVGGTSELEVVTPFDGGEQYWLIESLDSTSALLTKADEGASEIVMGEREVGSPSVYCADFRSFLRALFSEIEIVS